MTRIAAPIPNSLAGRLLLAMPGMPDPRFERSVVAMCVHDAEGALGISLDTELEGLSLHDLLDDLEIERGSAPNCAVFHGGPVEPGRGFVLHTPEWRGDGTVPIGPTGSPYWALTGSRDVLRAIAQGRGPAQWIVALGYAGWGPGQLDSEMRHHGWYAAKGSAPLVFDTETYARWSAAWRAEGIDPSLLSPTTGTA